jgi:transcription-repair coupling factor (superfamily II helicase)
MLDLYASRAARSGRSMSVSPLEYERFAAGFPFELTDDQASAIEATLADLRSPQSMDRLVCGDVGFGKTEVALRAAFVAALSGAQVAILAPTTLLAQQHFRTFSDRFADWPVNVEVLSRFRTTRETRNVLSELAEGQADIVIGTHKLLQPDVRFKNLGLVIVDEEHRFGVRQKEKLKRLRTEVDILTLTATPIPRTLNMAMGELRDLSLIATPPEARLAVKTFVTEWQDGLLREACQRELKRGGQVYFVHNRIEDIEKQTARLAKVMPDAKIRIAHGQMRETELEQIMLDFYHRRFHILACTAIIESGIDIPSANTIIINRADRFGLAQLHQLRGRVGRSHHKAFALLLTPPANTLTDDARKRLTAIEAMEDLGAGFVLATHDLEIRGAGELLGEQQTGQMQQIGFSLYTEMLGQAVQAIRRGETLDIEQTRALGPELNMHLPALLPEDYLPDIQMRLVLYKRIASAPDTGKLSDLKVELIDRFGLLPNPTRTLFRQAEMRLRAGELGLKKLEAWPQGITVEFGSDSTVDPTALVRLIQAEPEHYAFDAKQRLRVLDDLNDSEARFAAVEALLNILCAGPGANRQAAV